jgi:hypothetical protein
MGMVGYVEATAAYNSVKAAFDIAKGVMSVTNDVKVKLATSELIGTLADSLEQIVAARKAHMDLLDRITELESALAKKAAWEAEKASYELRTSPFGPHFYALTADGTPPSHRLCANCFDKGERSVLQTTNKHSGGEEVECNRCSSRLKLSDFSNPNVNRGIGNIYA